MGQEALAVIKAWKESNAELLDKAFAGVDDTTKKMFEEMNRTMSRLEENKEIAVKDVERLSGVWSNVIKNLPLTNPDPELYFYRPKVVLPVGEDIVPVRLVGAKLASGNPRLARRTLPSKWQRSRSKNCSRGWIEAD